MVSYYNAVAMFPAPNRHAPHHAAQTPYFAYGYPPQQSTQYAAPNMNMGDLNCNLQQFPMGQFASPADTLQHHHHHHHHPHHQAAAVGTSWHQPYPMSTPGLTHHASSCARNTGPTTTSGSSSGAPAAGVLPVTDAAAYDQWSLHVQPSQSPHSPSPCSQHIVASPSPHPQASQSPTALYPHYKLQQQQQQQQGPPQQGSAPPSDYPPSCSQPQDLSSGAAAQCGAAGAASAPAGASVPSSATITATAIATVTASAASPDSGLAVSSDGVSSSDSPHQQHDATQQPHPLSQHQHQHQHQHHGQQAPAPLLAAARPQPVRSPYEWMKKPSYQNQPNPGKTRTKDKYRVVYTDHQRLELEKEFHYSRYITIRRKSELASFLGLSERQVKIWFQNRRAKERKQVKKREELMQKEKMEAVTKIQAAAVAAAAAAVAHNGLGHKPVLGME